MAIRKVFYSFHFDNDVMRVQQIRQMGVVEGDEPVAKTAWEEVRKGGNAAIEKWIDSTLKSCSCLVVLIGTDTHTRPWVRHEVKKAWEGGKGIFGIHIHNLACPRNGKSTKGTNPLSSVTFKSRTGAVITPQVYDPPAHDAYNTIAKNLSGWVEAAIRQAS